MKQDLLHIKKNTSITDIICFLEAKYKYNNLNYQKVYYQFRKLKPLLGPKDCYNFLCYLEEKNFYVSKDVHEYDSSLCKLFFASHVMQNNYQHFGDILLLDSTYNTNIYRVPLLVFSGIARDGRNILFGFALLNDETYPTIKWAYDSFLDCHNNKKTKCCRNRWRPGSL